MRALFIITVFTIGCGHVDYDEANVHDVELEHDALHVYHDDKRSVTCYSGASTLSCLPDVWLHCEGGCR